MAIHGRLSLIDLDALVESAQSLDPLPASVGRLATLVARPDADLAEIVEVISYDQALTGALLRRANSAASSSRNPIRTVQDAVVRLGTATVLALAMTASVANRMGVALPEYGLAEGELWRHSVSAALAAETIRSRAKVRVGAEVVTAALLHDVGKLVLARFIAPQVAALLDKATTSGGLTRLEAEAAVMDVHHAELGGLVAQHWRLPESLVQAISYHHTPEGALTPICFAVHLANLVAGDAGSDGVVEPGTTADGPRGAERSMEELALDPDSYGELCATVRERFADVASRYA